MSTRYPLKKMILTAIVILLAIFLLIWIALPSVPAKFPPGGSRKPLPWIGDAFQFGTDLFQGFAKMHKVYKLGSVCLPVK